MEPKLKQATEKIIVALDVDSFVKANDLVEQLTGYVGYFKIGLQFLYNLLRTGQWNFFSALMVQRDEGIFVDSKLADIPNTIAGAAHEIASMEPKPTFFNIHASAGKESMIAAVENKANSKVLAVTVLTSIKGREARSIFGREPKSTVPSLTYRALEAGVDGIICSAQELKALRGVSDFDNLLMVTPGIRPQWAAADDQKRITTPRDAILDGADYLVIGRPIRKPPPEIGSPVDAAKKIAEEISGALEEKEA